MPYFRRDGLKKHNKILFGPFVGELGWEIKRWAGFIRWFKSNNPSTIVNVCTREGRKELYSGYVDSIITFEIDGDYVDYRPNQYNLDWYPEDKYQSILALLKTTHKDFHIVESPRRSGNKNYFDPTEMDFNFTPTEPNTTLIDSIMRKNMDKIPIAISPRHRIDMIDKNGVDTNARNWVESYWEDLYSLFERHGHYYALILGQGNTYKRPPITNKACYCLEDYIDSSTGVNSMGLVLAAIQKSKVVIGQQSALPILANHMGIPTVMWGHEQHRHQVIENPLGTKCVFFPEKSTDYITNPSIIYESIGKLLKDIKHDN
ncbi:MAG: hypothetical protein KAS32_14120 [Candidatus Peribacteraceae bacterium]|nr:hypothetical protein [Candidatus Peribacteraceae bacterium]